MLFDMIIRFNDKEHAVVPEIIIIKKCMHCAYRAGLRKEASRLMPRRVEQLLVRRPLVIVGASGHLAGPVKHEVICMQSEVSERHLPLLALQGSRRNDVVDACGVQEIASYSHATGVGGGG